MRCQDIWKDDLKGIKEIKPAPPVRIIKEVKNLVYCGDFDGHIC